MPPSPALGTSFTSQNWKGSPWVSVWWLSPQQSLSSSNCSLSSEAGLCRLASYLPQCWAALWLCGGHHPWTLTFFKRIKQNPLIEEGSHFLIFLMCFISSAAFCPQCLLVWPTYQFYFPGKKIFCWPMWVSLLASQEWVLGDLPSSEV